MVGVAHPSLHSLIRVIVEELNMAENTVMRVQTGQLGRRPTSTIFKILQEHSERLQKLYAEGTYKFISPLDDNLRLLVIVLALYPIVYREFYIVAAEFVVATFSLLTTVKLSWYLLLCSFSVGKNLKDHLHCVHLKGLSPL